MKEGSEPLVTKQPTDHYRNDPRVRDYLDKGLAPNMYSIALLAAADRTYHVTTEINPALLEGKNVVCDRYLYSSLAFFKARGIDYEEIRAVNKDIPHPDVVIFLDIPPEKALERVHTRDGEDIKFEEKNDETFSIVRKSFLEVLPHDALIIDSKQDIDTIHEIVVSRVREKMREK